MADTLHAGEALQRNQSIVSLDGRSRLILQDDGNLVLYATITNPQYPLWASGTDHSDAQRAVLQHDGIFSLLDSKGAAIWSAFDVLNPGPNAYLNLQNNGNLILWREPSNIGPVHVPSFPVWTTNTYLDIVRVPSIRKDLGDGHLMVADAQLHVDSRVASFNIHETCTNKVFGFTGGVKLFYYGKDGKLLGDSGTIQYGINQAPLFEANHRNETWSGQAPPGTMALGLAIFADPHNRFGVIGEIGDAIGDAFSDVGSWAGEVIGAVKDFCGANPNVCVASAFVIACAVSIASGGTVEVFGVPLATLVAGLEALKGN